MNSISRFKLNSKAASFFTHVVLILIALVFIVPLYWMVLSAFRDLPDILTWPIKWFPLPSLFSLKGFELLFTETVFLRAYFNSAVVAVGYIGLSLFICSLGGYALSKYDFPGRNILFLLCIATLMIPPALLIIPNFIIIKKLGWVSTYAALIFPAAAHVVALFLMRQFIEGVPDEFLDAARMDGCSEFRLFWNIVLPMTKHGIIVTTIILFGATWNSFLWPLIAITEKSMYTLPLLIPMVQHMRLGTAAEIVPYHVLMAAAVSITTPLIIMFLFVQKYFIRSVALTLK